MESYTGIGSRNINAKDMLDRISYMSEKLARLGLNLRSGGSNGCDAAFEMGCDRASGSKEIFLPWKNFNGHTSHLYDIPTFAFDIAKTQFPKWDYMKDPVQRLFARNVLQLLGQQGDNHSIFVLAHFGSTTRSTGTLFTCSLAKKMKIPVFLLGWGNKINEF